MEMKQSRPFSFFTDNYRVLFQRGNLFYLIIPLLVYLAVFYAYPMFQMISRSLFDPDLTLEHYQEFFSVSAFTVVMLNTFSIAFFTTILCLLLGYPIGYLLTIVSQKTAQVLMMFIIIPFWISILVRSYAWMVLLGRNGILNQIFGAPPWKAFLKVFFPLSLPGVAGGGLLVFIIALGFFITPALLGGPKDTMISLLIQTQIEDLLNWGLASALATILLINALIVFVIYNRFLGIDRLVSR